MSDDCCTLEPIAKPPHDAEATGDELSRAGRKLVDQLQQAGVDLQAGPSLDETKRLLVELVRQTRQQQELENDARV